MKFDRHTTLKALNKKFGVPTVKKPPPLPVATTIVSSVVMRDLAARNGPTTIQGTIRRTNQMLIPR